MKAQFRVEQHEGRPVYRLAWVEVERILGRQHCNTAGDDAKLARALRAAGARPTGRSYSAADGWHAFAPRGAARAMLAKRANPGPAKDARAVHVGKGYWAQVLKREQTPRSYAAKLELSLVEDGSPVFGHTYDAFVDAYPAPHDRTQRRFFVLERDGQTWIDEDIESDKGKAAARAGLQSADLGLPKRAAKMLLGPVYEQIFPKASGTRTRKNPARPKARARTPKRAR